MKSSRIRPKKWLGQNFLRDENIARKIIAAIAPRRDDVLMEIGPGEGALTKYLVESVYRLIVIDVDREVVERMRSQFGANLEVLHGDFLRTDLPAFRKKYGRRVRLAGNIPYNITTPILFHVLDQRDAVQDLTIMLQREVAQRLAATEGTKSYGILSVFCQLFAQVDMLFDVSPNAFFPKPAVMSTVVRLTPRSAPLYAVNSPDFFRVMVRAVFGKRRKTLRNSLSYFVDGDVTAATTIDLGRRPEDLSIEELVTLSNTLHESGFHVKQATGAS